MKKILFFLLLITTFASAEVYEVENFQSDIFSKDGNRLKKITLSLRIEGSALAVNDYKITDALNIIISSFYLEDLFTSQGKERFKSSLTRYMQKKYLLEIKRIYIKKFKTSPSSFDISELLDAMKNAGCCQKKSSTKKVFDAIGQ